MRHLEEPRTYGGAFMLYFAYGSNLRESRLRERAPSARFVGIGRLFGHELRFHKRGRDGSAKADAHPARPGSFVWGAVAELDDAELPKLDEFEPGYRRSELPIEMDRSAVTAWVYRAEPAVQQKGLRPHMWYVDHILNGGRDVGLPVGYLARVASVPTLSGQPDGGTDF